LRQTFEDVSGVEDEVVERDGVLLPDTEVLVAEVAEESSDSLGDVVMVYGQSPSYGSLHTDGAPSVLLG
jgi:hypothetical protein